MSDIEDTRERYGNGYYEDQLKIGVQFQDVVAQALYREGIVVVGFQSYETQVKFGENLLGAEIKRDGCFRKTGNLYIEIAEKSHPDRECFRDSGIHRKDNSWLFVIGDESFIFIFSTRRLRQIEAECRHVETPTSKGFLLPMSRAMEECAKSIIINKADNYSDL